MIWFFAIIIVLFILIQAVSIGVSVAMHLAWTLFVAVLLVLAGVFLYQVFCSDSSEDE